MYDTGEKCMVLERLAMVEGWEKVHIIHGLNISHKELIYLLKNLEVIKAKYYAHAPRGIDW